MPFFFGLRALVLEVGGFVPEKGSALLIPFRVAFRAARFIFLYLKDERRHFVRICRLVLGLAS